MRPNHRRARPPCALSILRSITAATVIVCWLTPAAAQTIRQYQYQPGAGTYRLALVEVPRPEPGPDEVLVEMHAWSMNTTDLYMLEADPTERGRFAGGIPLSDGAGEVVAVGADVTRFDVGDRVAGIFLEGWIEGDRPVEAFESVRGGNAGGVLAEMIVSNEQSLVAIPDYLTYEEAATLPCTAVTAWTGLFKRGGLRAGEYVLLEGTGGVSSFGLLFAAAAGARPIITSSSDAKLERAAALGAVGTVNYRTNPEWQEAVRALTGGEGVKQVLEVGGRETLPRAMQTLAYGAHVAMIGELSGFIDDIPIGPLMVAGASITGIYVGSRADFEAMNAFLAEHEVHPVIDRAFAFDNAEAAFDFMANGDYMGKIVIRR